MFTGRIYRFSLLNVGVTKAAAKRYRIPVMTGDSHDRLTSSPYGRNDIERQSGRSGADVEAESIGAAARIWATEQTGVF